MYKSTATVTATFLLLALIAREITSVEQELVLYANNTNYFGFKNHVPDIKAFKLGDSPLVRICVRGTWVVYEKPNFQEFLFGMPYSRTLRCWNHDLKGLNSFRYLGGPDTEREAISFYDGYNFEENELLTDAKRSENIVTKANKGISSFAISGNVPYTFYSENNFQGSSLCFNAPNNTVLAYSDIDVYPALKTIRSFKQGCKKGMKHLDPTQ